MSEPDYKAFAVEILKGYPGECLVDDRAELEYALTDANMTVSVVAYKPCGDDEDSCSCRGWASSSDFTDGIECERLHPDIVKLLGTASTGGQP